MEVGPLGHDTVTHLTPARSRGSMSRPTVAAVALRLKPLQGEAAGRPVQEQRAGTAGRGSGCRGSRHCREGQWV